MIFDRHEPRLPIIGPAQGGRLSFFRLFLVSGASATLMGKLLAELSEVDGLARTHAPCGIRARESGCLTAVRTRHRVKRGWEAERAPAVCM
jgi:hypothetical protein